MWRTTSQVTSENPIAIYYIQTRGLLSHVSKTALIFIKLIVLTHELRVLLSFNLSLILSLLLYFTKSSHIWMFSNNLVIYLLHCVQRACALNALEASTWPFKQWFWTSAAVTILCSLNCWFCLGHRLIYSNTYVYSQCLGFLKIICVFPKAQQSPHWYLPNHSGELIFAEVGETEGSS